MGDDAKQNPMKELQVEKLILNISVGTSGDPLEKARRVLKQLTGLDGSEGQEPVRRRSALRRGAAPRCSASSGWVSRLPPLRRDARARRRTSEEAGIVHQR